MNKVNDPNDKEEMDNQEDNQENPQEDLDGILGQIKESKNNVKRTTSKSEDSQKQDSIKSGKKVDDSEPEGIDGILNHLTEKDEEVGEELNFIERIIGQFTCRS